MPKFDKDDTVYHVKGDGWIVKRKVLHINEKTGFVHFQNDEGVAPYVPALEETCFKTIKGAIAYLIENFEKGSESMKKHAQILKSCLANKDYTNAFEPNIKQKHKQIGRAHV